MILLRGCQCCFEKLFEMLDFQLKENPGIAENTRR